MHCKEVNPMKRVLFALALVGLVAGAGADENDLSGCALITHYVPEMTYSEDPGVMCSEYLSMYAIGSAPEQVNRIDVATYVLANWFIIAAHTEDKTWCGAQFGFDNYPASIFGLGFWGPCYPATGGLEIPSVTPPWPGPGAGTALVVTGDAWVGNYLPQYYFGGYAYGYGGMGVMQLIPDPTVANPFGGLGNCLSPPVKYDAHLGGMGINTDGTYVEPTFVEPEAVCCHDGMGGVGEICEIVTQAVCNSLGGEWYEMLTSCTPNPCLILGACCNGGYCTEVDETTCLAGGGTWLGPGTTCVPNPCEAVCCVGCDCYIVLEEDCAAMGGVWHPEWTTCTPNPCGPTPADEASWGTIKALYR
jgi:hypothetical protein